jgi:predicted MFS family arabinose efflux permease
MHSTNADTRALPKAPAAREKLPLGALLALAMTGFLTVLAETIPAGLLPQIATGLHASATQAGQLLTVYAAGSMLAAIPLTALTRGLPRRQLLLATILTVGIVNAITAMSGLYAVTLASRLVAGMAAGVQWAMIAGYAMRLVTHANKGRALAISMAGVPLALALGLPLGTFLGDLIGWRYTFAAMAALALIVIAWALSQIPTFAGEPARDRIVVRKVLLRPGLIAILAAAFAFELGHMNLYTYVAPFLARAGLGSHVGALLLVFGVAAMAGLWTAGTLIDKHPRAVVLSSLTLFVACMLAFGAGLIPTIVIAAMAAWGFTLGGAPTIFQAACAKASGPATDIAQSMLVTVLNAGMAAGSLTGGLALKAAGVDTLAWISFAIFAAALTLAIVARRNAFPPMRHLTPREHASHPSNEDPRRLDAATTKTW